MSLTTYATSSPARTSGRRHWAGVVVMSLGVSLIVVDATIMGVLLPLIVSELGLTTADAEWAGSVYALVFAALLIPSGRAGDLFGRRRAFLLGVGVFVLASVGVAAAQGGSGLIAARAVQGVGAAMVLPATLATVNALFTGRDRAVAFGLWGSMIAGMAALGPLVGGALASAGGWRWAFAVNVPMGAALIAGALALMPETRAAGRHRGALHETNMPSGVPKTRMAGRDRGALRETDTLGGVPETRAAGRGRSALRETNLPGGGPETRAVGRDRGALRETDTLGGVPETRAVGRGRGALRGTDMPGGGPEIRAVGRGRGALREIDVPGGALSVLGLGAVVCGLIEGQTYGWWAATRPYSMGPFGWPSGLSPVPVVLGLGVVLLTALVAVERARAASGRPVMLDLSLFRIASFRYGNLASALVNVGELGLVFVLPLFLVGVDGAAPLQISLAILPLALGAFVSGGYAGKLANRHGAARVVQLGMALEVLAVVALALTLTASTSGLGVAPWMLLYGVGLGLTSSQLPNVSLADVPQGQAGQASGTQSTARQVGAALGIALIGTVFATGLGHSMAERLRGSELPPQQQAAIAQELRQSAGTYARELHADADRAFVATAANQSLAEATRHAALVTAAILTLGLVLSLRIPKKSR